jgi:hypothetical protein
MALDLPEECNIPPISWRVSADCATTWEPRQHAKPSTGYMKAESTVQFRALKSEMWVRGDLKETYAGSPLTSVIYVRFVGPKSAWPSFQPLCLCDCAHVQLYYPAQMTNETVLLDRRCLA